MGFFDAYTCSSNVTTCSQGHENVDDRAGKKASRLRLLTASVKGLDSVPHTYMTVCYICFWLQFQGIQCPSMTSDGIMGIYIHNTHTDTHTHTLN